MWFQRRDRVRRLSKERRRGISEILHCGPMLSIAVSSGVLAAVVLTDDERVLPHLRDYAAPLGLARVDTPELDTPGLASQTLRRPVIGHR
jgi:hypothetical protein